VFRELPGVVQGEDGETARQWEVDNQFDEITYWSVCIGCPRRSKPFDILLRCRAWDKAINSADHIPQCMEWIDCANAASDLLLSL
jgi:hypothetical protein